MESSFEELRSDKALVCTREINGDQGGATVFMVVLADGFLIDCGASGLSSRRARVLANIINEGRAGRLSRAALSKVDCA